MLCQMQLDGVPQCDVPIIFLSPIDWTTVEYWDNIWYHWSGEPFGTTRSDVVVWHLDNPGNSMTLHSDPENNLAISDNIPILGEPYAHVEWAVLFYGEHGAPLCRSHIEGYMIVPTPPGEEPVDDTLFGDEEEEMGNGGDENDPCVMDCDGGDPPPRDPG